MGLVEAQRKDFTNFWNTKANSTGHSIYPYGGEWQIERNIQCFWLVSAEHNSNSQVLSTPDNEITVEPTALCKNGDTDHQLSNTGSSSTEYVLLMA